MPRKERAFECKHALILPTCEMEGLELRERSTLFKETVVRERGRSFGSGWGWGWARHPSSALEDPHL
jgi:hypothetical protein